MIYLTSREYRLLRYALTDSPDLSRDNLAFVAQIIPVSVGRILTKLQNRGLLTIERGQNRRILSMTPTFEFVKDKEFVVRNTHH